MTVEGKMECSVVLLGVWKTRFMGQWSIDLFRSI